MLKGGHPVWVVAAIVFLPLCGVPVIPLIILLGARLGPVTGSLVTCGALAANVSIGYWLAARGLRRPIEKMLAARGHRIPTVASEDEAKLILLCRLTPGVPLTVQNYLLGGARVHFGRYLRGWLVLTTPDTNSLSGRIMGAGWPHYNVEHLYCFNLRNLTPLLARAGFTLRRSRNARKVVTLQYLCRHLNARPRPFVTPAFNLLARCAGQRLRQWQASFPLGQMLLAATKD